MDEEWLPARDALAFIQRVAPFTDQRRTICTRAHAGLIQARAETLILPSGKHSDASIGEDFWWAEGEAALTQNWVTGDFSTWINQKFQVKAFGVHFLADDIYAVVPGSGKAAGRWIESEEAVRLVEADAKVSTDDALTAIIHCCGNQLVDAWCASLTWQYPDRFDDDERLDDAVMPYWFWMTCARHPDAILNWRSGNFAGSGETDQLYCQAQAKGVAFDRASLSNAVEYAARHKPAPVSSSPESSERSDSNKSPLSEAELQKWWVKRAHVRESLSQEELLILIRAAYPDNHISRDRIRILTGERKRGPKP